MLLRLPLTLYRYIGRAFIANVAIMLGLLLGVVLLFDTLELFRRASKKLSIHIGAVLEMSLLKLPDVGQQVIPLAVLFGAMYTFWRLTRSQELIVARAAGVSAWQFLLPTLLLGLLLGVVKIGVINPISSVLLSRYADMENRYFRGQASGIDISGNGLWLRQGSDIGEVIIHASDIDPLTMQLGPTMALFFEGDQYMGRLDAGSARLQKGAWEFRDGWLNEPERPPQPIRDYRIATDLTATSIEDSFAKPYAIPFWSLPAYIATLEKTGFSASRTRLYFYSLLAEPLLFAGMVLIAAAFSLRPPRRGGTLIMIVAGLLTGFGFFFLRDLAQALGMSETIPLTVAAWIPAICSVLTGIAGLLQSEDG